MHKVGLWCWLTTWLLSMQLVHHILIAVISISPSLWDVFGGYVEEKIEIWEKSQFGRIESHYEQSAFISKHFKLLYLVPEGSLNGRFIGNCLIELQMQQLWQLPSNERVL